MRKSTQNNSSNGGPDPALEGTLNGALNGAFASANQNSTEGLSGDTPKGLLRYLYKDAQKSESEVEIKAHLR